VSGFPLFFDEDAMSQPLIRALRNRGVDVESVSGVGIRGTIDEDVLRHSAEEGRVLYTFNAGHFCRIHREWQIARRNHPGIIIGDQQRFTVGQQLRLLLRILGARSREEMVNQVQFLSNWRDL
jgi:Domain of unknown function (DUF5615)